MDTRPTVAHIWAIISRVMLYVWTMKTNPKRPTTVMIDPWTIEEVRRR